MKNYIKNKNNLNVGNFVTVGSINIIIKDDLKYDLNLDDVKSVLTSLPKNFLINLDYIMFGDFDFLKQNGYNASYADGVIYVSNEQGSNLDVLDDIVHEIGHSVEERYDYLVYGDGVLEREFLKKRKLLNIEMKKSGIHIPEEMYLNPDYDENLDNIFANEIGYPSMTVISQGIYYSPYAATSLREYFANGFEAYFYHKDIYLKKVSPLLFAKMEELEMGENHEI